MHENYIKELQRGSYSDFNNLYNLYVDRLYGFVYNLTRSSDMTEEIVQEVFLKVWQIREHISPDYSFQSLLFTIAKNKFLNSLRKQVELYWAQNEMYMGGDRKKEKRFVGQRVVYDDGIKAYKTKCLRGFN